MEEIRNLLKRLQGNTGITYSREQSLQTECERYNADIGKLTGYNCELCKNKGFFMKPIDNEAVMIECSCRKIRNSLARLNKSGLGILADTKRLDNFETPAKWQSELKNLCTVYSDNPDGHWLFIGGQSGIGKSHLCTAITVKLIKSGLSGIYMLWRDEITKLKAAINDNDYQDIINPYKSCDVLYIDDLFKRGYTESDVKIAFEIINRRYYEDKLTIITSEYLIDDIIKIDEAVGGRIREKCGEWLYNIPKNPNLNYRMIDNIKKA